MSVVNVTSDNFVGEVLNADVPVLVEFWADWCNPCKMLSPVIEELAEELDDVKICSLNIDEEPEVTFQYHISSVPTVILFRNGAAVKKTVGVVPKETLIRLINTPVAAR